MKTVFVIFALVASAMAQTQNTPFVDYMLALQSETEVYYDVMTYEFRYARRQLSNSLMALNYAGSNEFSQAMTNVTELGVEAAEWIEGATGDAECIRTSVEQWSQVQVDVGNAFATCVDEFSAPIVNATSDLLEFIVLESQNSFEAQNLVLTAFVDVNAIAEQTNIALNVAQQIDEIYRVFELEVIPDLYELVEVFLRFQESLPIEIRDCFQADLVRINDEALVLRNTLELC